MIFNNLIQLFNTVGKERLLFFISHIAYNLVLFLLTIIAAKIAGPAKWGIITLLMLIASYSSFLTLGINNGMGITLPKAIALRDEIKCQKIKSTAFTVLFITLIFIGLIQLLLALILGQVFKNWLILFGFTFSLQLITYFKIQLRSLENFKLFTIAYCVQILSLFIGLLGLVQGSHYLFILGAGNLISSIYIWINLSEKPKIFIHKDSLSQILKIGFPVMMAGVIGELLLSVDRLLISIFLDNTQLGYYGFGSNFFKGVRIIGIAISIMILPKIVKSYAKQNYQKMVNYGLIQQWSSFWLMGFSSLIIGSSLFYFLPKLMPDYIPSLHVSVILLGVATLIPLGLYPNILNTIGKQKVYLMAQIFGICFNVILSITLIYFGYGIEGVALGSFISMMAYVILIRYLGNKAVSRLLQTV